jgi:lauroyl/myristoyl acyltransferase
MGGANRGSIIRSDRSETGADIKAAQNDVAQGDAITRRPRKLESRPAWKRSDLRIALDLAMLLLPSWILPERLWAPLCRATMHKSSSTKQRGIKSNAETIRAALDEADVARSEAIALELKVGVQELRLQDLRGWRPGGWSPKIVVEGEEHLRSALAGGSGAILWVAPFVFNSAPTKIALHQKGHRVSHLSSPKHGFSETEFGVKFLNRIRCIPEDRYLAARIVFDRNLPSTAMRRMMRALKAGEVVSIVAASTEGSDMVKGPIFGGRLPVAVGAPRLAALTGAPLLPLFTVRDPKIGFRIVIEAPIAIPSDQTSDERCIAATAEFLRRSEPWVRQFPGQWRAWSKWRRE